MSTLYIRYPSNSGGGGSGVSSINSETGAITIAAGSGITVTDTSNTITIASTSSGGSVTSVSVVSANGLAGTVATATTTPAITLSTSVTGVLKGNGTAISAATAGTDYVVPSGSITGTAANITATSNSTLTTLSALSLPYSQVTGGPSANAITALTGDITATGPGSVPATLATVNLNTGSIGSSTSIPSFTVNGKGLITEAAGNAVIAPAGTLTGTTLASNVVTSSLTQVGTISTGVWNGTIIPVSHGGTSQVSVIVSPTASTYAGWDANKNMAANNFLTGFTSIATASGTTTLSITSPQIYVFTGSSNQTMTLPSAGVGSGTQYTVINLSSGTITVQSSGANTVQTLAANSQGIFTCLSPNPTTAANWSGTNTPITVSGSGISNFGAALYSGGFQNGSGSVYWYQQSSSQADWIATIPGPTLTTNFSNGFGTVVGASGDLPGITLPTVPKTGTLKITATSSAMYLQSSTSVYLTDGSGTFINAASMRENVMSDPAPFTIIGYYNVTASSSYTFKLQGDVVSGTTFLGGTGADPYILDFSVEYVA